ncbi:hypothetical protein [Brevundimonas sp.]
MGPIVHRSSSLLVMIAAAGLMTALPGVAKACRLGPVPTESQRIATIEQRQTEAWERSLLVYLAEVVEETRIDVAEMPFGQTRLRLVPLILLKGDTLPTDLVITYAGMDDRCGRDFLDIQERAQVGDRFVIYAATLQPSSEDNTWSQAWLEVRDPQAIRALAEKGWVQRGGWQDRER